MSKEYRGAMNSIRVSQDTGSSAGVYIEMLGPNPSYGVSISRDDTINLRNQLNEIIGDVPAKLPVDTSVPAKLPVGTIVVGVMGEGLTEAQLRNLPDVNNLRDILVPLGKNIHSFVWQNTAEGYEFWATIHSRLNHMLGDVDKENKRRHRTPAVTVRGHHIDSTPRHVVVTQTDSAVREFTPEDARLLAKTLIMHADSVDRQGTNEVK
jgi:hypothetical protein